MVAHRGGGDGPGPAAVLSGGAAARGPQSGGPPRETALPLLTVVTRSLGQGQAGIPSPVVTELAPAPAEAP